MCYASAALRFLFFILLTYQFVYAAEQFIVGGSSAGIGQFPYQVSLRKYNKHICGGSIISNTYILTAAHCVYKQNPEDLTVVTGSNLLDSGGDKYTVAKLIPHPSYALSSMAKSDIALIQLTETIEAKPTVGKIKLPTKRTPAGTEVVLTGWGSTSSGHIPNELQMLRRVVISRVQCAVAYPMGGINKGTICTSTKDGKGAGRGDSGGPLVAGDEQVGITSWGNSTVKGKPDVFTNVFHFLNWIKKHSDVT